ncbi:hypothetical protein ABT263_37895 [Kitasatospora sp. NPDC001603]|uniref:hypothetical protein n=1 Tax=Kitasatospora sp. NPDC001603 TaxID=3154388 RepID=UPI0033316E99
MSNDHGPDPIRQALGDLTLHGLVASDGNTKDRHKTWRLEGTAGLVLNSPSSGYMASVGVNLVR